MSNLMSLIIIFDMKILTVLANEKLLWVTGLLFFIHVDDNFLNEITIEKIKNISVLLSWHKCHQTKLSLDIFDQKF